MKRTCLAVAMEILLTGCAGDFMMDKSSDAVRSAILGKRLEEAITAVGMPAEEKTVARHRIIIWKVGGGVNGSYGCELRADIDKLEVVRDYQIEGARGACYEWLHAIK